MADFDLDMEIESKFTNNLNVDRDLNHVTKMDILTSQDNPNLGAGVCVLKK
jgi:hypothetical protein